MIGWGSVFFECFWCVFLEHHLVCICLWFVLLGWWGRCMFQPQKKRVLGLKNA